MTTGRINQVTNPKRAGRDRKRPRPPGWRGGRPLRGGAAPPLAIVTEAGRDAALPRKPKRERAQDGRRRTAGVRQGRVLPVRRGRRVSPSHVPRLSHKFRATFPRALRQARDKEPSMRTTSGGRDREGPETLPRRILRQLDATKGLTIGKSPTTSLSRRIRQRHGGIEGSDRDRSKTEGPRPPRPRQARTVPNDRRVDSSDWRGPVNPQRREKGTQEADKPREYSRKAFQSRKDTADLRFPLFSFSPLHDMEKPPIEGTNVRARRTRNENAASASTLIFSPNSLEFRKVGRSGRPSEGGRRDTEGPARGGSPLSRSPSEEGDRTEGERARPGKDPLRTPPTHPSLDQRPPICPSSLCLQKVGRSGRLSEGERRAGKRPARGGSPLSQSPSEEGDRTEGERARPGRTPREPPDSPFLGSKTPLFTLPSLAFPPMTRRNPPSEGPTSVRDAHGTKTPRARPH